MPLGNRFLTFWKFISPAKCWESPTQRHSVTTWKTWLLINTSGNTSYLRYCCVACPHVNCSVQETLRSMHWMVLTHPAVNLDLYPYDFHVFSSLKKVPDLSQMKSERLWWCSNSGGSWRFFWRWSMDWCVKRIPILVVMVTISNGLSFFAQNNIKLGFCWTRRISKTIIICLQQGFL